MVVVQDLLLEGLTAYINLNRAMSMFDYAERSVVNVQKQTGLEQSRVDMGGGFTSDVLQAKSQLAGAQARLARAKGALVNAGNRFRALFGGESSADDYKQRIVVPQDLLPASLDDAVALARSRNRQLEALRLGTQSARAEIDRVRGAELFPKINAVAENKLMRNPAGVLGDRNEQTFKLEMTYQFNAGLASVHSLTAAREALAVSRSRLDDTRDLVEEQVRNAWQNLVSARENASHLDNQTNIVGEFLRMARDERVLGLRSLIDVLSGETTLINAQSDAASAVADVAIAAFTLLKVTGTLDLDILK
ncbi:hypothetical protein WCLP8_5280002 [uncultured Gammaproteobacteria bacterium]